MTDNVLKQIKARLTKNNYKEKAKLKSIRPTSGIFILAGRRLTAEEIAACYYSVESFDGDDELHAVGTLIDDNVYNKLDEEGKERYVLNAAELYSELKNEVLRHRKSV